MFRILLCLFITSVTHAMPDHLSNEAQAIIQQLKMEKIPHEGPYFVQTFKSTDRIEGDLAEQYDTPRVSQTAIYALMTQQDFSALHQLKTDEIWHFYAGDPLELLLLHPDGQGETVVLGSDLLSDQHPQYRVPAGVWMGAKPLSDSPTAYALTGHTMTPGFEYEDYIPGDADRLLRQYPDFAKQITALVRDDAEPALQARDNPIADPVKPDGKPGDRKPVLVEHIGRQGQAQTNKLSVAYFEAPAGYAFPASINKLGHEAIIVVDGTGQVKLDGQAQGVQSGSVVYLPAKVPHQVIADTALTFYAVVSPAFDPNDYVPVNHTGHDNHLDSEAP